MIESKYLGWLKLSAKQALILFIISTVLLFGGEELIASLGLLEAKEILKPWVGVAWIISISIIISEPTYYAFNLVKKRIQWRIKLKQMQKTLHNLTPDEKIFLSVYIDDDTKTQSADYNNGVVSGLVAEKIIFRSSNLSQYYTTFPYNIQPWAWEYLKNNPEILR